MHISAPLLRPILKPVLKHHPEHRQHHSAGSMTCYRNQYPTSYPVKGAGCPVRQRQQERPFAASAHPAAQPSATEALALPRGWLLALSIPYTTVTLS